MEEIKQSEMAKTESTTSKEEEKKGEDLSAFKSLNMDEIMKKAAHRCTQLPWRDHLNNKESLLYKEVMS